jgi:hypothetical protein
MVDYRDHYDSRQSDPYQDTGGTNYIGPMIALAVVAVLIGSMFFLSGGTGDVDVNGNPAAPAVTETMPAAPAEIPVAPEPAVPAPVQ